MAIFQTCNLSSAVSACLFIDLQGQVVEQRIALSTEPEPALMPIFPALASCGLCAAPGIWCTAPPCCCCTSCALACSRPTHSVTTPPPWLAGGAGEGGGNRFSSLFAEKQPVLKITCAGQECRKATCFVKLYLCRPKVQRVEA